MRSFFLLVLLSSLCFGRLVERLVHPEQGHDHPDCGIYWPPCKTLNFTLMDVTTRTPTGSPENVLILLGRPESGAYEGPEHTGLYWSSPCRLCRQITIRSADNRPLPIMCSEHSAFLTLSNASVILDNLLVSNCHRHALHAIDSSLTVRRSHFLLNSVDEGPWRSDGGALLAERTLLIIEHSLFEENFVVASNAAGGAIALIDPDASKILHTSFLHNFVDFSVAQGVGGAVYISSELPLSLPVPLPVIFLNCTFIANDVQGSGAALAAFETPVYISGATFANNTAGLSGGAILLQGPADGSPSRCSECTFHGNSAAYQGGALFASAGAVIYLASSELTDRKSVV